jgi:hypothetical protein
MKLDELLSAYWEAAYAEGKEGRDHDTEDGVAQRALSAIHEEVAAMVKAEREACAKIVEETEVVEYFDADDADATLKNAAAAIRAR